VTQAATPVATPPVIRALLDQARDKNYRSGVLGVRARPKWDGPEEFEHQGVPVRVVPCVSTLAVREALLGREPGQWLVVLTDRDDADLGAGVLSRLVWHRLRTPDPWDAVRQGFAASGIDPALTTGSGHRDLAGGLLAATPTGGWPPAPGGVLTRDHALGTVARVHLGLGGDGQDVDPATVLRWTTEPEAVERIVDLRTLAGDTLTDAVLTWAAQRAGAAGAPLGRLLAAGAVGDAVPLGLVAGLLVEARQNGGDPARIAHDALIRLEAWLGPDARDIPALRAWATEARAVTTGLLRHSEHGDAGKQVVTRADALLDHVAAGALAAASDLLPSGLTERFTRLAAVLAQAAEHAQQRARDGIDLALVPAPDLEAVEAAWQQVAGHRLSGTDRRTAPFHAAVRLVRWLATSTAVPPFSFAELVHRYSDTEAWVDSAVNDAATGVTDSQLGYALEAVLAVVRRRRSAHDRAFATALAAHTENDPAAERAGWLRRYQGVCHIEDLLPDLVLRMVKDLNLPVLLLVLDGMSAAVAAEVVEQVLSRTSDGWIEALPPGEPRRITALAALPTLTEVSRASLLCGELRRGDQKTERQGYAQLVRDHGLPGAALFHKAQLDTTRPGHALSDEVVAAIDDVAGRPLVTCVLNAIDDALDRSDPVGAEWGPGIIKHLDDLLDRASKANRVVVLTSDHGHVVERREGTQQAHPGISSARSRPGDGAPAGDGEVLVTGRRVLLHDRRAVLAVDERLRYGPLKAGYHGGAAPAEVIVPVCVLVPGAVPNQEPGQERETLRLVPRQEPAWWSDPVRTGSGTWRTPAPAAPARRGSSRRKDDETTAPLFDVAPEPPRPVVADAEATAGAADPAAVRAETLADAVLKSKVYAQQKAIAGRVALDDGKVRALLVALLTAGGRLTAQRTATALQVPPVALRGALAHAFRLLNVEGYPVLAFDVDGETVVLDEKLLREQFEVRA